MEREKTQLSIAENSKGICSHPLQLACYSDLTFVSPLGLFEPTNIYDVEIEQFLGAPLIHAGSYKRVYVCFALGQFELLGTYNRGDLCGV